jgi:hypothetical protein
MLVSRVLVVRDQFDPLDLFIGNGSLATGGQRKVWWEWNGMYKLVRSLFARHQYVFEYLENQSNPDHEQHEKGHVTYSREKGQEIPQLFCKAGNHRLSNARSKSFLLPAFLFDREPGCTKERLDWIAARAGLPLMAGCRPGASLGGGAGHLVTFDSPGEGDLLLSDFDLN